MPKLLVGHWIESTRLSGAFFVPAVVSGAVLHKISQRENKREVKQTLFKRGNYYD